MAGNANLNAAARAKKDEFYTQLEDIEAELKHYRKHFKGKTVLCNCDDPFESNFFKYFALNFNRLGLKKLIATSYAGSPIAGTQMQFPGMEDEPDPQGELFHASPLGQLPYKAVITHVEDATGDGAVSMVDVEKLLEMGENELSLLEGDGDFRSQECLDLLDEADIVCTNPPFSLFREYVHALLDHKKRFLIIGNQNAIKYKEVFPLFMSNDLWLGYDFGDMAFRVPNNYEPRETRYWQDETGQKWRSMGNICWFTNLDIKKRHEKLILYKKYDPSAYPKYVNYDAIEVSKVLDIPCDYSGLMGVPVTFMDYYNPAQFDILGMNWTVLNDATLSEDIRNHHSVARRLNFYLPFPDGKGNAYTRCYDRIVVRNRHPEDPQ